MVWVRKASQWVTSGLFRLYMVRLLPNQARGQVTEDDILHPMSSRSYQRSEQCFRLFSLAACEG